MSASVSEVARPTLFIRGLLGWADPSQRIDPPAVIVAEAAPVADYGPIQDGKFLIPAVDVTQVDPQFLRQQVAFPKGLPNEPGTIVVDPKNRFLYLVVADGRAVRYRQVLEIVLRPSQ